MLGVRNPAGREDAMTITLPPEVETALAEQARRRGTTPELLAVDCLRQRFVTPAPPPAPAGATLAESVAGHIGVLSSGEFVPGGAHMSEDTGRKFAAGMARKREGGRL
jgi:hypothetical protein